VSSERPAREQLIEIDGRGFDPARQYAIALVQADGRGQWLLQGPSSTSPDGSFAARVTIPDRARTGEATIIACSAPLGQATSDCARRDIQIRS
jgi:hypothetical protein